jgi:hypothetical protein
MITPRRHRQINHFRVGIEPCEERATNAQRASARDCLRGSDLTKFSNLNSVNQEIGVRNLL